jgi:uncharacterized RmlC-like cupin family protein
MTAENQAQANDLRLIRPRDRDLSTAQTPGMERGEGVGQCTTGPGQLWSGHVSVAAGVRSAPHHHGAAESSIYIITGRARLLWGERLENVVDAEPGDFIYVPPHLVHQEINPSEDEPVTMIVSRSPDNIVVNVDIPLRGQG